MDKTQAALASARCWTRLSRAFFQLAQELAQHEKSVSSSRYATVKALLARQTATEMTNRATTKEN